MEIVFKIIEYVIYSLIGVIAIIIPVLFYCKYMEAEFSRQEAEDLEAELEEVRKEFKHKEKALIKEAQDWKLKATAPIISSSDPMPMIINRSNIKKIAVRYELEAGKTRDYATQKGIYEIMKAITPFINTEFSSEFGREIMYQEIFIGIKENL